MGSQYLHLGFPVIAYKAFTLMHGRLLWLPAQELVENLEQAFYIARG